MFHWRVARENRASNNIEFPKQINEITNLLFVKVCESNLHRGNRMRTKGRPRQKRKTEKPILCCSAEHYFARRFHIFWWPLGELTAASCFVRSFKLETSPLAQQNWWLKDSVISSSQPKIQLQLNVVTNFKKHFLFPRNKFDCRRPKHTQAPRTVHQFIDEDDTNELRRFFIEVFLALILTVFPFSFSLSISRNGIGRRRVWKKIACRKFVPCSLCK